MVTEAQVVLREQCPNAGPSWRSTEIAGQDVLAQDRRLPLDAGLVDRAEATRTSIKDAAYMHTSTLPAREHSTSKRAVQLVLQAKSRSIGVLRW